MSKSRARESTNAIGRLFVTMRHLMNRGFYKPMGVSGKSLREALLELRPEIYGAIAEDKMELNGLFYVLDRLPEGIEQCTFINLTSDEGYEDSSITPIIPPKRRRKCYRIDKGQMNIQITRGRSDIYDILTHLTFLFIESHKIAHRVLIDDDSNTIRDWQKLEEAVGKGKLTIKEKEIILVYTANIIGRTYKEVAEVDAYYATDENPNRFLKLVYWLGKLAIEEIQEKNKRTITFSNVLKERLGQHIHGDQWAKVIKQTLLENNLINRPLHIVSANMHSVMNYLYSKQALRHSKELDAMQLFEKLSDSSNRADHTKILNYARKHGLIYLKDTSGTNINVQIIDVEKINGEASHLNKNIANNAVLLVMDYAFGEQAYETMDELLKIYKDINGEKFAMQVESISIMGKAGILDGGKGDIMIPNAHVFEGTADNYPLKNELSVSDFDNCGIQVVGGPMITVLGTSLQNKEVLKYFKTSTWGMIGLEMEGAHYQKAIQSASKIRKSIEEDVRVLYAYYASDNPLESGSTLASGGLGLNGVKPTYLITQKILEKIL
ncbi:MAG: DUF6909 family protein [Lishizhenia sp.]